MKPCSNSLIPERLHTNDKPEVQNFDVGDNVYRRCNDAWIDDPFGQVSLYDLSLNRATLAGETVSLPDDVLLNIEAESQDNLYYKEATITLTIMEVDAAIGSYYKLLSSQSDTLSDGTVRDHELSILLKHDCLACNYAHCVIELRYDGEVVNKDNYSALLGKKKGAAKRLRNAARIEIEAMITYRQLWINDNPTAA